MAPTSFSSEQPSLTPSAFSAPCFSARQRRDRTVNIVTAGPCTPACTVSSIISFITRWGRPSRVQQVTSGLGVIEEDLRKTTSWGCCVSLVKRDGGSRGERRRRSRSAHVRCCFDNTTVCANLVAVAVNRNPTMYKHMYILTRRRCVRGLSRPFQRPYRSPQSGLGTATPTVERRT